ncbi:MAG: CoA transferase, partial [Acidimicrobiaceae bacterium]|nr:CoA transferase [Acidimicrobiaceae bacterium]
IEVPMADTVKAWMLVEHGSGAIPSPPLREAGYPRILTPNRKPQKTLDGWINVLPYARGSYDALFEAGGRLDLVGDARYASGRARILNSDFLYSEVAKILATRTTAEWLAFCRSHDIPAAAVASLDDMVDELPVASHPVVGDYRVIPAPVRFRSARASESPVSSGSSVRRPAPLIGADTDEVLNEVGFAPSDIAALRESGAVPAPPALS